MLKPARIATVIWLGASLSWCLSFDQRFRTFDKISIKNNTFPWRQGGKGYVKASGGSPGSDYVVVGTLDGGDIGPYASFNDGNGNSDDAAIFKAWAFLRRDPPPHATGYSPTAISDRVSAAQYGLIMDQLGAPSGARSKRAVLKKQLVAETERLPDPQNPGKYLPSRLDTYIKDAVDSDPLRADLVFEVGNEPNAYPAMEPEIYAWYYLKWRKEILASVAKFNQENPGRAPLKALMMPAGLWMFEGMPSRLLNIIGQGIDIYYGNVITQSGGHLSSKMYTNTLQYYQEFLTYLRRPVMCEWGNRNVGQHSVFSECGDYDLDNVKNITWEYHDADGHTSNSPTDLHGGDIWGTISGYTPNKTTQELIDVGNLHFYPFVETSYPGAWNLTQHFSFLKQLSTLVAQNSSSGEVWITELGNINPETDQMASTVMAKPVLEYLKAGNIPQITRWYWYQASGDDHKWDNLVNIDSPVMVAMGLCWGGTAIQAFANALSLALLGGTYFIIDYDKDVADMENALRLVDDLSHHHPVQGLLGPDGALRSIGKTFYNQAAIGSTTIGAPTNLSLAISNYQETSNLGNIPWVARGNLTWDWTGNLNDRFIGFDLYYSGANPPSASAAPVRIGTSSFCSPYPAGSTTGLRCTLQLPEFGFGQGYVQVKATDDVNEGMSAALSVNNPYPVNTFTACPDDLTKPLNMAKGSGVSSENTLGFFDMASPVLPLQNIWSLDGQHYATKATGNGFSVTAGYLLPVNSSNLQANPKLLKVYPDGACTFGTCTNPGVFEITSIPAGLTAQHFVIADPPDAGYFEFSGKNGSTTWSRAPGITSSPTLTKPGIVWLKDVLTHSGDEITAIRWKPGPITCPTNNPPKFFRTITISRINPAWPVFNGYESTPLTYASGGLTLPLFRVAYGSPLRIKADITPAQESYTVSIDASSASKGIGFSFSDQTVRWTPTSAQLGVQVVELSLSKENPSSVSRKVAIEVVAPAIQSTDKTDYSAGDPIVINGLNFVMSQANPAVTAANLPATVIAATDQKVTALLAQDADAGPATVKVSVGQAISNSYSMTVVPVIASFGGDANALLGTLITGKTYTLYGKSLGYTTAGVSVQIGAIPATVLSANGTSLTFKVPLNIPGQMQQVVVRRNGAESLPYPVRIRSIAALSAALSLLF